MALLQHAVVEQAWARRGQIMETLDPAGGCGGGMGVAASWRPSMRTLAFQT
jgi:hypothetical protein